MPVWVLWEWYGMIITNYLFGLLHLPMKRTWILISKIIQGNSFASAKLEKPASCLFCRDARKSNLHLCPRSYWTPLLLSFQLGPSCFRGLTRPKGLRRSPFQNRTSNDKGFSGRTAMFLPSSELLRFKAPKPGVLALCSLKLYHIVKQDWRLWVYEIESKK